MEHNWKVLEENQDFIKKCLKEKNSIFKKIMRVFK